MISCYVVILRQHFALSVILRESFQGRMTEESRRWEVRRRLPRPSTNGLAMTKENRVILSVAKDLDSSRQASRDCHGLLRMASQ